MTILVKRTTLVLLLLGLVSLVTVSYVAFAPPGGIIGTTPGANCMLSLAQQVSLPPGPGRIDHMDVDAARGRLYVAMLANDSLAVVDLNQGNFLRSVTGLKPPREFCFFLQSIGSLSLTPETGQSTFLTRPTLKRRRSSN